MKPCIYQICLLFFVTSSALANFRCPNTGKIARLGMSMYEVKLACGQPSFRAIAGNVIGGVNADTGTLGPEQWTYDFGPSAFIQFFNFDGGKLRSIDRSDQYGTPKSQKRSAEASK
jgi:hypothetical protein